MTSYLVTIETDHHTEVVPNDVLSCGENLRKTFKEGGGGGNHPFVHPRVNRSKT